MGTGKLRVELYLGDQALPMEGVTVIVKTNDGSMEYNLITNANGKTKTIELEAPDIMKSWDPSYKGETFSRVNVYVLPEVGFSPETIEGVQIFDQETSILPVKLKPVKKGLLYSAPQKIEIPPKFGLNDDKNSERNDHHSRIEVLQYKEVTIPEYITVHLGKPNQPAENVRVKFIDYLKNVASSEIYPTWPKEALEANIYAQISFVLNRIYTQWYRSKGYPFDITNSTTVDQYFVKDRNIFESVSKIVDKVFNTYMKRAGRIEPYFSMYCNGTTVSCDGLSQWGTVPLANDGYSAYDILKYYYPPDIQLVESNNFSKTTESYPGQQLVLNSKGPAVKLMQDYLNRISVNYPLIPQIKNPNGVFDTATKNSVTTFQSVFDLPQDGIINKETWYKITAIYVAVKRLAEMDSEGERMGIGLTIPDKTIKLGSRGEEVVELQFILNYLANYYTSLQTVIEDARFGETTRQAVIAYQQKFMKGKMADGIVGADTWNSLYDSYRTVKDSVEPKPEQYPTLRRGMQGEDVLTLQKYLNIYADYYPSIPKIVEDGIFGGSTENAVRAFQRIYNLNPDGIVGPLTWDKIINEYDNLGKNEITITISFGMRGEEVRKIQNYLNKISEFYPDIKAVTEDGIFGKETLESVRTFQTLFDLSPDGVVGKKTYQAMQNVYDSVKNKNNKTYPGYVLKIGSRGEEVRQMQIMLNQVSDVNPAVPAFKADGIFGVNTENQVLAFQRSYGLTADGIVGPQTWNQLVMLTTQVRRKRMLNFFLMSRFLGL